MLKRHASRIAVAGLLLIGGAFAVAAPLRIASTDGAWVQTFDAGTPGGRYLLQCASSLNDGGTPDPVVYVRPGTPTTIVDAGVGDYVCDFSVFKDGIDLGPLGRNEDRWYVRASDGGVSHCRWYRP